MDTHAAVAAFDDTSADHEMADSDMPVVGEVEEVVVLYYMLDYGDAAPHYDA